MENPTGPIRIPLTPEQQELIGRRSGQFPQVLEVTPDPADPDGCAGSGLRFSWRLSTDSPQQPSEPEGLVAEPPAEPVG